MGITSFREDDIGLCMHIDLINFIYLTLKMILFYVGISLYKEVYILCYLRILDSFNQNNRIVI